MCPKCGWPADDCHCAGSLEPPGEPVPARITARLHVANTSSGKRVTVIGFGTFLPRRRKARAGRSPANGKEIKIPAKTLPAFAAGQGFKEAVDKK